MNLSVQQLTRMIDLSAVRPDTTEAEVRATAEMAREYRCICASTLPGHTPLLVGLLVGEPEIGVSGNVSFPSGGATRSMKIAEARELLQMGCDELDVVINIGLLRSGQYGRALDEIKSVVETAGQVPVKAILECHYLSDDEIRRACELCIQAGAAFVKTGTGWAPTGATLENVALIKSFVGDAIGIKASGGIRQLETVKEMYRLGARRFGLGFRTALPILKQCASQSGEATAG
ncbi:MAG: deoxyribose-phosphate aldolase [Anaerolineae bacterium]|nr:MAG: deoxyribose-phosphate aldolase [Anaerolineae bacterium]